MGKIDHNSAVRQIGDALKGPVAVIFRKLIPALSDLSGQEFYDAVMASSDLLHGCLLIFRKRRDAFAELLVDARGRPVNDDFVALRCGRSVHDIIAMIVRTHAKQHFRTSLGGDPNDPKSRSGRMYQAVNEYLIHEWQIPLVQHYTPIPLARLRELGPGLLDCKTVDALKTLVPATTTQPTPSTNPVVARPVAPPIEPPMLLSTSPEHEFWWETVNDTAVRAVLGDMTEADMRDLTATLCQLGQETRNRLLAPLGLSLQQAAVLLGTCHRALGRAAFGQIFGPAGDGTAIAALTDVLMRKAVSSRSDLRTLEREVRASIAVLPRSGRRRAMAAAQ